MIVRALIFALVLVVQLRSEPPQTNLQQAHDEYEQQRQAAIRINKLAQQIHSKSDASELVSEIAGIFTKELPPVWASYGIRERVADAEYETVQDDPAKLVSEQRIIEVWNRYIREIRAPDEALVTVAEVHNMRDADLTAAQYMWAHGSQTIWTMPNIYAVGSDGKVADGCRAVETIRLIHELDNLFLNLRAARDRVRKGIVPSEQIKQRLAESSPKSHATLQLKAEADVNPIRDAERHYIEEHGLYTYNQLLKSLFDELFPQE
jgi:hypothetical protein